MSSFLLSLPGLQNISFVTFPMPCFAKTALAGMFSCAIIAAGLVARTLNFRLSDGMAKICSLIDVVAWSTSVLNLSDTENSANVDLFPILGCKVIYLKIVNWCSDTA